MRFSYDLLQQQAAALGFTQVGVIPAAPSPTLQAYERWIAAGMHGAMGFMAREDRVIRRRDLNVIVPGVRALVIAAVDYGTNAVPDAVLSDPRRGRISNYAWGADYHTILTPRLEGLAAWLREQSGGDAQSRVYVDTGAVLERSHAQQAGLGFVGKNTMLIHPRRGPFMFLGEIVTALEFDRYDAPGRETMCGTCRRCLAACPTGALPEPYVLDARRCISYLTIELKDSIPPDLRPLMGNWVYGCDVCQQVCPFTRFVQPSAEAAFWPVDADRAAPPLADLLALDDEGFRARFAGSPIARIKRERLVRNACVAAGNSGLPEFGAALDRLAIWALARLETAAGV
ncbi:MAG TPA: tRNA epoxyqueuosine(34) reductase QueG [Aggregatilinea sp.]|uniref:tRNA epoxyqueuosine(34) reductase QueG n=1 Tax=Aggregatilinea sp. TaxID=2806333 RepID=UPI002C9E730A|nr:tRNA epoxyqueuosine(34) reductase QueG [Aggregatilinea sp.]HML23200.1 tRNA epoxyqueuosine(34) reductase QueG [Aggregatilinea sp.]